MTEAISTERETTGATETLETDTTGRALVPLTPMATEPTPLRRSRPDATFVVHLIATAGHAPQTRELRRAEANDVMTTYRGTTAHERVTAPSGRRLSRVA